MNQNITTHCLKCETQKIHCRGMCKRCYERMYRSTDKGKAATKKYNSGKGAEARARFREKRRLDNPPKIKLPCACGSPSISKNLCRKCYSRHYQQKRFGRDERKYLPEIYKDLFDKVLIEVKKGATISGACKMLKVSSRNLYAVITESQKKELRANKLSKARAGLSLLQLTNRD